MSLEPKTPNLTEVQPQTAEYETPCIESVLSPEELERQVFYAGAPLPSGTD